MLLSEPPSLCGHSLAQITGLDETPCLEGCFEGKDVLCSMLDTGHGMNSCSGTAVEISTHPNHFPPPTQPTGSITVLSLGNCLGSFGLFRFLL